MSPGDYFHDAYHDFQPPQTDRMTLIQFPFQQQVFTAKDCLTRKSGVEPRLALEIVDTWRQKDSLSPLSASLGRFPDRQRGYKNDLQTGQCINIFRGG